MSESGDLPPHDRLDNWDAEDVHRVEVSPRMLTELLAFGLTTSAGSSALGPELVVLDYAGDEPATFVSETILQVDKALGDVRAKDTLLEDSDARE